MTWRYLAQRALTGEFLDLDVPIDVSELGWGLSSAGALRGTLAPDVGGARDADGRLIFEEWGTYLYAEKDGEIRWGGIVTTSTFEGASWEIEAAEFVTYPFGLPYLGSWGGVQIDPLDAVREIWRHAQSFETGPHGISVDPTKSPVRLGTKGAPAHDEVYLDGKWQTTTSVDASRIIPSAKSTLAAAITKTATSLTLASLGGFDKVPLPFTVKVGSESITVASRSGTTLSGLTRGVGTSDPSGHAKGVTVSYTGTPTRKVEAGDDSPYRLDWFEAKDCGSEIDSLAKATPFDYREEHSWQADGTIAHRIVLGYPRLGRRRRDLAFIEGENVTTSVSIKRDGSDFANGIFGIGAGEGAKSLRRGVMGLVDGRLRRPAVYTDKSLSLPDRLDAAMRRELTARSGLVEISSIDVVDHPNAVLGAWDLGDDVLVRAHVPWLGDVEIWSRVTGWSLLSDTRARLSLARSDSFTYGGATS